VRAQARTLSNKEGSLTMTVTARLLAIASIAAALAVTTVHAAKEDYAFEPLPPEITLGKGVQLAVRVTHKPSGKPVEGVVLFRTRIDGSPHNMASMTAKHTAVSSNEPGVYKFRADFTMAGNWAFKLMAKMPGEKDTVEGTVIFKVK
jgi:YtkA-like